jgi:hypothetical protein
MKKPVPAKKLRLVRDTVLNLATGGLMMKRPTAPSDPLITCSDLCGG